MSLGGFVAGVAFGLVVAATFFVAGAGVLLAVSPQAAMQRRRGGQRGPAGYGDQ